MHGSACAKHTAAVVNAIDINARTLNPSKVHRRFGGHATWN